MRRRGDNAGMARDDSGDRLLRRLVFMSLLDGTRPQSQAARDDEPDQARRRARQAGLPLPAPGLPQATVPSETLLSPEPGRPVRPIMNGPGRRRAELHRRT